MHDKALDTLLGADAATRGADASVRLRALHVLPGLDPAHGGPSYSVPRLCQALAAEGTEITLYSVALAAAAQGTSTVGDYRDCRFAWEGASLPFLRNLRFSSGLRRALHVAARGADVVHDHGLWLMPNVWVGRAAMRAGKPLVVSPRGMLAPAALVFSRWKKLAFWRLLQGPAFQQARCFHATSEAEYAEIRGFGLRQPVAIIPNGIDLPELAPTAASSYRERVVLSLGRIHPIKGLDRLLRAWAKLEAASPEWQLRIVGPAEGSHDRELRALAEQLGLERVSIEAPIYGDAKSATYCDADLFVLPSANENFGVSVAEALAAGTPVVSTRGAPWAGLDAEGCGWWIEHGIDPLAAALATAMALPRETLKSMGAKGRAWMARDFSWKRVACDMLELYAWLVGTADRPVAVRLD